MRGVALGWRGRVGLLIGPLMVAIGFVALLVLASSAGAAKYTAVQCGWNVSREADWAETAGDRYNHSGLCQPYGADIWAGVQLRSYTRPAAGSAASETYGRWRWVAPFATEITNARGTWWHQLRNGFQHRLGGVTWGGKFVATHVSGASQGMKDFAAGFSPGVPSFEARLVCGRSAGKRCETSPSSEAMVRAVTLTLEDMTLPGAAIGGPALAGGWLRGTVRLDHSASDYGAGLRFTDSLVDGTTFGRSEQACNKIQIGGEWRGTTLRPCPLSAAGSHSLNTAQLSDGPHLLSGCAEDFAGNRACAAARSIAVDNNPPAAPHGLAAVGGEGWRRSSNFELRWQNPNQGVASPIGAARLRIIGPDGYDSGVVPVEGHGIAALPGIALPRAGVYRAAVWLRDQAGNETAGNSASAVMRLDDVPPQAGFRGFDRPETPETIRAQVADPHSGVISGAIYYRPAGGGEWVELPTRLEAVAGGEAAGARAAGGLGEGALVARFPSDAVESGLYEFQVRARDAAGNVAESGRRLNGEAMRVSAPLKFGTRLSARLESGRRAGTALRVGFGARPVISGRLVSGADSPLGGQPLRLLVSSGSGARVHQRLLAARTDGEGRFQLQLGRATSRRVEVRFPGTGRLAASRAPDLTLRVRGSTVLRATRKRLRTGGLLRLRGRVKARAAWIPSRGKLVAVQFRDRGARRWRPVLFVRTDRDGRFRARYRFRRVTGKARIRLRAVALPESRWPYAAGPSRPVRVTVTARTARK